MNQEQMFYKAGNDIGQANIQFLQMAGLMPYDNGEYEQSPTTKKELETLIAKRPEVYSKYYAYLDKLN